MRSFVALFLLAFFVGAALCHEKHLQSGFTKWMREHNKVYPTDEFQTRYSIWKDNHNWVTEFNARADVTFTVGLNEFADLTNEEFNRLFKGLKHVDITIPESPLQVDVSALPTSVDWRTKGVVTGIKNQGQCGSCW